MDLDDPIQAALLAAEAFTAASLPCALYGGLLTAVYGEPRETRDADFAVLNVSSSIARDAMIARGIDAVVAFDEVVFGGLRLGRVTLIGSAGVSGLNTVDLVEPRDEAYARRVLDRSVDTLLRGQRIRIVGAEDYVVMKVLSTRDRDLEDAAAVFIRSEDILEASLIEAELDTLETTISDARIPARRQQLAGLVAAMRT